MSDDEESPPSLATKPPPQDDDDPYGASTKVGEASADLLAMVRSAEEAGSASARKDANAPSDLRDATSDAPTRVGPVADVEVPRAPRLPSIPDGGGERGATKGSSAAPLARPGALPPVLAIAMLMLAVTVVLAGLAR